MPTAKMKLWSSDLTKKKLSQCVCHPCYEDWIRSGGLPLFTIHSRFHCSDTTSRIFNVGKQTVFGKLKDPTIINAAKNFTTPGLDKNLICEHGLKAMVIVCGGKLNVDLMQLRYNVLGNKILAAKKFVSPERLPPTESATITVCALIYRLWSGWGLLEIWIHMNGDGRKREIHTTLNWQSNSTRISTQHYSLHM